jgi:hypothetical protein
MARLGDDARVEARFGWFEGSANLDARLVHCLCRTYHRLGNHFRHTQWNSYVMWVLSNLVSVHLETLLVSVQDRCTVCAKHRNNFGHTRPFSSVMRLKWNLALVHLEIVLILTQNRCTVCAECTIGLEIILDTPDGTPRWCDTCGISFQYIQRRR